MTTMYQAVEWQETPITKVEVERVTDSSVYVMRGKNKAERRARHSQYVSYYPTWEEARDALVRKARIDLQSAELLEKSARDKLNKMLALKEPK